MGGKLEAPPPPGAHHGPVQQPGAQVPDSTYHRLCEAHAHQAACTRLQLPRSPHAPGRELLPRASLQREPQDTEDRQGLRPRLLHPGALLHQDHADPRPRRLLSGEIYQVCVRLGTQPLHFCPDQDLPRGQYPRPRGVHAACRDGAALCGQGLPALLFHQGPQQAGQLQRRSAQGPAAYHQTDVQVTRLKAPQYTIAARVEPPGDKTLKPGPGAHSPEKVTMNKPCAPIITFGIKHSDYMTPLLVQTD